MPEAEAEEIVDVPEAAAVPANWPTNGASPAEAENAQVQWGGLLVSFAET